MIAEVIKFVLVNFTVTLFVLGLAAAGVRIARARTRTTATATGAVLDYFILFSIGVSYTWNAVVHSVFGDFSAKVIGWGRARSSWRWRSRVSASPSSGSWPSPAAATCWSNWPRCSA